MTFDGQEFAGVVQQRICSLHLHVQMSSIPAMPMALPSVQGPASALTR